MIAAVAEQRHGTDCGQSAQQGLISGENGSGREVETELASIMRSGALTGEGLLVKVPTSAKRKRGAVEFGDYTNRTYKGLFTEIEAKVKAVLESLFRIAS